MSDRIQIDLSAEQFRQLLLSAYLGSSIVRVAHEELEAESSAADPSAPEEPPVELPPALDAAAEGAAELMHTLLEAAAAHPELGDLVEKTEGGELFPGTELESLTLDCADVYTESTFWTLLAERLAERDLGELQEQERPLPEDMGEADLLQSLIEMYLVEFAESGLNNLMIPLLDENEMSHPN